MKEPAVPYSRRRFLQWAASIDKLSAELLHSQIEVFAKVIHRVDAMSATELKGV